MIRRPKASTKQSPSAALPLHGHAPSDMPSDRNKGFRKSGIKKAYSPYLRLLRLFVACVAVLFSVYYFYAVINITRTSGPSQDLRSFRPSIPKSQVFQNNNSAMRPSNHNRDDRNQKSKYNDETQEDMKSKMEGKRTTAEAKSYMASQPSYSVDGEITLKKQLKELYDLQQKSDAEDNSSTVVNHVSIFSETAVTSTKAINKSFLFLNETKSLLLGYASEQGSDRPLSEYSIDVLIVGSQFKLSAARKQFTTWGSHRFVRNFILSTEDDDPVPNCSFSKTLDDVAHISQTCRSREFWRSTKAFNPLTRHLMNKFAHIKWLKKKKNAAGWICAQRRFVSSFVQVLDLYQTDDVYPDYLIIADDDTYINMENITEYLLLGPQKLKEDRGGMIEDDNMYIPMPTSPTIFAGCRIRSEGVGGMLWTMPFGGYGVFLSQGSLKQMTQPIHCGGGASYKTSTSNAEYQQAICEKYLHNYTSIERSSYPFTATIGEEVYFQSGDSLNKVFNKYVHDVDYFCLHSDWFFGYIANFLNVSRHVSQKGELPTVVNSRVMKRSRFDEDENSAHVSVNRLHTIMSSEIGGRTVEGNCMSSRKCVPRTSICHYIPEEDMEQLYQDSLS